MRHAKYFLPFSSNKNLIFSLLAGLVYTTAVIQTAWVSDDTFITFRSIENYLHGYGLVYNIGERVQTYTHPLWFLLQSIINVPFQWLSTPAGLNRLFFTNLLISILLSVTTMIVFATKVARSTSAALLGVIMLVGSKAYLDYSTSGLENPLSHLLFVLFFWIYLKDEMLDIRRWQILSMLAGLAALNRLDTILIYLPALVYMFLGCNNKLAATLAYLTGFLPIILWELFSIFYYGAPIPNTAYAKLGTGIDSIELMRQGVYYFLNSLRLDPITLLSITGSLIVILSTRRYRLLPIVMGLFFYLFYILSIGGDFMSGRYFSLPYLTSVALLSTILWRDKFSIYIAVVIIGLLSLAPLVLIAERRPSYKGTGDSNTIYFDSHKISDERMVYSERTSLSISLEGRSPKIVYYDGNDWIFLAKYPTSLEMYGAVGMNGYRAGPNVHVLDRNGLIDPLMARMPVKQTSNWRIGHFHHTIPAGYEETLIAGENLIEDKNVARYYDKLSYVIHGPLWDWDRIIEIWNLNTGKYEYLIEGVTPESTSE